MADLKDYCIACLSGNGAFSKRLATMSAASQSHDNEDDEPSKHNFLSRCRELGPYSRAARQRALSHWFLHEVNYESFVNKFINPTRRYLTLHALSGAAQTGDSLDMIEQAWERDRMAAFPNIGNDTWDEETSDFYDSRDLPNWRLPRHIRTFADDERNI